jgi:pimeloyl-ACP methyl ester carboxylesterase
MQFVKRNGASLAYEDVGMGSQPIIFVHGWSCDHTAFEKQSKFFDRSHRVVSVDLRGHGESDAPDEDYTMASFADDLAYVCTELGLVKPTVVGHSMGGNVALELAARHPTIAGSIVLIDSVVFPPQSFRDALQLVLKALHGPDHVAVCRQAMLSTCLTSDDAKTKMQLIAALPKAPQYVLTSTLKNHLIEYDSTPAAAGCRVPAAYIGAAVPIANLEEFQSLTPQLVIARTLGSGHFSPLFVPEQINSMLTQFLTISSLAATVDQAK